MVSSLRFVRPIRATLLVLTTTAAVVLSLGLGPRVAELGRGPDATLTVRAKGSVGEEMMEVRVGGDILATFVVGTEWRDYRVETPSAAVAPQVEVAFLNDAVDPEDRNLWVDFVSYGGRTYEAEADTTYGTGVWQHGARCRPGYHRSQLLACRGHFAFGDLIGTGDPGGTLEPAAPTSSPADAGGTSPRGSTIAVSAAGNVGRELIEVRVDGEAVATFELGSSPNLVSDPRFETYSHVHPSTVTLDRIEVAFVNDRYARGIDHNVRIGWIALDGHRLGPDRLDLEMAPGVDRPRCAPGWKGGGIVACNSVVRPTAGAGDSDDPTIPGRTPAAPPGTETGPTAGPAGGAGTETGPTADPAEPARGTGGTTGATSGPGGDPSGTAPDELLPQPSPDEQGPEPAPAPAPADGPGVPAAEPPTPVPALEPALPTPPAPVPSAPGRFYVVGTDIIDPDGNIFYPIGANVAIEFTPYGYVFEGNNGGVNDHLADVRAWNWNTIRATLICDNDSGVPSFDKLVDGIHPTIERFTDAGIVVMLECHDATGSNLRLGSAKDLAIRKFWDVMVERYKDNPYVWFNIYNEPYSSADTAGWARLHRFYVDRIRAAGAENIIVADIPVWGQGIHLLADQSFAEEINRRCNTVFGWHAYGAIANRQGSLADHEHYIRRVQGKDMALIIGEYGVASPANWGNAGPWAWNLSGFDALTALGPRYGIGLLWWHATGDQAYFSLYALKNDRSGFWTHGNSGNLTPYGKKFWDVSHRVEHTRGPFTGDLADSGCPSAGG